METPFDRRAVRRHRDRAATTLARHDFLLRAAAERLAERLAEYAAETGMPFRRALVMGAGGGILASRIAPLAGSIVEADLSRALLTNGRGDAAPLAQRAEGAPPAQRVVADEEMQPFAAQTFDLVTSALVLHWVNDLPGVLVQIRRSLTPGGMFVASLWGGETLRELRAALLAGDAETRGGASPRISPFADVRDAGNLLQRTGFVRAVADIETLTVTYTDPLHLMAELRTMGEANALNLRSRAFTPRATILAAAAAYREQFAGADGRVPATFQLLTLTGWTPDGKDARTDAERPPKERPPGASVPHRLLRG